MMRCCCNPIMAVFSSPLKRRDAANVPSVNTINRLVLDRGGDINKELRLSVWWNCPKDVDSYSSVQHADGERKRYSFAEKEARYQSAGANIEVLLDVDNTSGNVYGDPAVENRTFDGLPSTGLTRIAFTLHDYSGAGGEYIRARPSLWSDGNNRDSFIGVPFPCDAFVVIEHRDIQAGEAPLSHYALVKMPNIGGQETKEKDEGFAGLVATVYKCNGEYMFVLGGEYEVTVDIEDERKEMRRPEIIESHGINWVNSPPDCN